MDTFKPLRILDDSRIPFQLQDTATVAEIFNGLALCLDMIHQSVDSYDSVLSASDVAKMTRFCKSVCEMATDYHNDKIDMIYQQYTQEDKK